MYIGELTAETYSVNPIQSSVHMDFELLISQPAVLIR
jgi:hypothetical protein